jgi:class 3 adenylate cyclase
MPVDRADRRRTTILFADVVGYSTIAEQLDPEDLQELITGTFAELVAEVQRREGVVEKFIGDAVMVTFGASPAHEDDPERAVTTALSMLDVVRRWSAETGVELELRIGINSGLIVAGPVGDGTQTGVVGDAVNVAARLQQAAAPGEVVVSEAVWRRVSDRFEAQPLGDLTVKGRTDVVGAYRITGPALDRHRRLTPFVGRAADLDRLESAWRRTLAGQTAIVAVVGEAGVGKSRLLAEFPVRADALDVRIHCDSEEAFGPIVDLVTQVLGGRPQTLAQLRDRVEALGVGPQVVEPIGSFLNVHDPEVASEADADGRRRNLFAAILGLLRGAATDGPVLMTCTRQIARRSSCCEISSRLHCPRPRCWC